MNWEEIKQLILSYAETHNINEEIQKNKNLTDKIKELSQNSSNDQEKILKLMLEVEK